MINTVVFDIGNVLIDFRWQGLFEDLGFCGEKFERIADATVRSQWWNEFDRGIMSLEEIIQKFTENAPEYEKEIRSIFDNMDNLLHGRAYANDWIRELRARGCKVYILSNMSLSKFCQNEEGVTHYKLDGNEYNYDTFRLPTTPLSEYEQGYCYNDVRGLCECIKSRLKHDTLASIPLTSTGYVRRELRTNVRKNKKT